MAKSKRKNINRTFEQWAYLVEPISSKPVAFCTADRSNKERAEEAWLDD